MTFVNEMENLFNALLKYKGSAPYLASRRGYIPDRFNIENYKPIFNYLELNDTVTVKKATELMNFKCESTGGILLNKLFKKGYLMRYRVKEKNNKWFYYLNINGS